MDYPEPELIVPTRFSLKRLYQIREELEAGVKDLEERLGLARIPGMAGARYAGDLSGLEDALVGQRARLAEHDKLIAVEEAITAMEKGRGI